MERDSFPPTPHYWGLNLGPYGYWPRVLNYIPSAEGFFLWHNHSAQPLEIVSLEHGDPQHEAPNVNVYGATA